MGTLPNLIDKLLPTWPGRPDLAVCTMDFGTGEREVFGPSTPQVAPSVAVTASCALPGWFAPVPIGERVFVDGGSHSFTSVDVALGRHLDEVYVLAPLAYVEQPPSSSIADRLLRQWRLPETRQMYAEVELLRRDGVTVRVLAPDAEDLAVLGRNPMNVDRRLAVLETAMRRVR